MRVAAATTVTGRAIGRDVMAVMSFGAVRMTKRLSEDGRGEAKR